MGIDNFPLRMVSRLSDDCLAALGEIIGCIERLRLWPPPFHVLVRVPKPTGGHRLIALLHDHAKLWGVIRRPWRLSGNVLMSYLRPFLRPFKMKVKRHMRDLGHEQSGPYARRFWWTDVDWSSWTVGCGDHELEKD